MITELFTVLSEMKNHAERERHAIRHLQARHLFDLAAEGEALARRLGMLLARVPREAMETKTWGELCVRAGEVRAIARANAELMRRSLEVVRATRQSLPEAAGDDAPVLISRVA